MHIVLQLDYTSWQFKAMCPAASGCLVAMATVETCGWQFRV